MQVVQLAWRRASSSLRCLVSESLETASHFDSSDDIWLRMLAASSALAVLSSSLAVRCTDSRLAERLFSSVWKLCARMEKHYEKEIDKS